MKRVLVDTICMLVTKKTWLIALSVVASVAWHASAASVKVPTPPRVETSTLDADKAAVQAAASEADQWAAKNAKKEAAAAAAAPPPPPPAAVPAVAPPVTAPPPAAAATPPVAPAAPPATPAAVAPPPPHRSGLNEMRGKLESKGLDPRSIRIVVDGGFNVEFTYDTRTSITDGSHTISMDDIDYHDDLILRYSGKDLYAVEITRVGTAPRPQ